MSLAAVVSEKKGPTDLAHFGGAHNDARRFRLDLKEFFDRRQHADEVRIEHALEDAGLK